MSQVVYRCVEGTLGSGGGSTLGSDDVLTLGTDEGSFLYIRGVGRGVGGGVWEVRRKIYATYR